MRNPPSYGPRRALRCDGPSRWRSAAATAAVGAVAITAIVTIGVTTRGGTQPAFANQVPARIAVAREEGTSRAGERPALSIAELADQRIRLLEQTSERVEDTRNQSAFIARQSELADANRAIKAESRRLRTLDDFFWPTAGGVSDGFGYRIHPILRIRRLHNGADIGGRCGQPIWATQSGTVTKADPAGYNGGSGHNVRIAHGDINGVNVETAYLHMDTIRVKVGERVAKGERIGTVGSTGLSTACHLHLTLYKNGRASDPLEYLKK